MRIPVESSAISSLMRSFGERPIPAIPLAVIVASLSAGLVLKIVLIGTLQGGDDVNYYQISERLLKEFSIDTHHHHAGRLIFLLLSGFPAVLGGNVFFGALANVIYCLVAELLVIGFLHRMLGPAPAAIGGVFIATAGTSLVYAGGLLPEVVFSLFSTSACLALFAAVGADGRTRRWWAFAAGIAASLAYSAKEPGVLLIPPAVFCLLFLSGRQRDARARMLDAGAFIAPVGAFLLVEALLYGVMAGDFFYRAHALTASHNRLFSRKVDLLLFLKRGVWGLLSLGDYLDFFLIPILLASASWAAMLRWRDRWAVFPVVGAFCALYLCVGTSSPIRLVNIPASPRHLHFLFPLIAIGVGYLFWRYEHALARAAIVGLVLINAATSVHGATHLAGNLYFQPLLRNAAIAVELLPQIGEVEIYVDRRYRRTLRHYLSEEAWRSLREIRAEGPMAPGYYLVLRDGWSRQFRGTPEMKQRLAEITELPVVLRVGLPHSFASRYFPTVDRPELAAIVHQKK